LVPWITWSFLINIVLLAFLQYWPLRDLTFFLLCPILFFLLWSCRDFRGFFYSFFFVPFLFFFFYHALFIMFLFNINIKIKKINSEYKKLFFKNNTLKNKKQTHYFSPYVQPWFQSSFRTLFARARERKWLKMRLLIMLWWLVLEILSLAGNRIM